MQIEPHDIVSFEKAPPFRGGLRYRAVNIKLVERNPDDAHFGKLARFVREKSEEVA